MLNYIGMAAAQNRAFLKDNCQGKTQRECLSNRAEVPSTALTQHRSWLYQQCTQYVTPLTCSTFQLYAHRRRWGYFISGSDIPQNVRTFLSRAYTMEYSTLPCRTNFKHHEPSPSRFHQQVWRQELQFSPSRGHRWQTRSLEGCNTARDRLQ